MKREAKMILLLSDARGHYIPRDFANGVKRECISGVSNDDLDYLARGPDDIAAGEDEDSPEPHDASFYWDTWNDVCNKAIVTDFNSGVEYFVYPDGDCWLIEKGAEFNDGPRYKEIETDWYMDDGQEDDSEEDDSEEDDSEEDDSEEDDSEEVQS